MKRYLFVLFLSATFLMNSSWSQSLEARPPKIFKPGVTKVKKLKLFKSSIVKPSIVFPSIVFPPIVKPKVVKPWVVRPKVVVRPIRTYVGRSVVIQRVINPSPMRIVKVLDTTHVLVSQSGTTQKVRLLGLDPVTSREVYPEVHSAAVTYMKKAFEGKIVYLDFDSFVASEDQDGTKIAYVFRSADKRLVNEDVIEHGFALAATAYKYEQKEDFRNDQLRAEKTQSGVWSMLPVQGG